MKTSYVKHVKVICAECGRGNLLTFDRDQADATLKDIGIFKCGVCNAESKLSFEE